MTRAASCILACAIVALAGCQQTGTTSNTTTTSASTSASSTPPATTPSTESSTAAAPAGQEITMPDGLKYQDLKVGDGALAEGGKNVAVHYTGWLTDGTKFDSSVDRGQPFTFELGAGQVIPGWDEGVKGMRVGGKRKLTVPANLGYGSQAMGPIPANSTLVFDVELLSVR